ncbi:MAG: DUF2752 domain-containing protein [Acidobacteria bacterium]|nr:DUF2752 domain-containing protein [Acidobacteriota bacterium]
MPSTTEQRSADRQLGLLWGAVAATLVLLSPLGARLALGLPRCPLKVLAGFPCPACGTTRSALALAHLDFAGAFAVNPLATVGWVALIAGGLVAGAFALAGRPLREPREQWPGWVRGVLVAAVVLNWTYLLHHGT